MSDFDFDKSFSEDFRKGRLEEPSSEKWERVSATLRQNEEKKRRRGLVFLMLPYLLTAASLGLFLWNMKANQRQLSGLQVQVGQLETALQVCGEKMHEAPTKAANIAPNMTEPPVAQRTASRHLGAINKEYKMETKRRFDTQYNPEPSTTFFSNNMTPAKSLPSLLSESNSRLMPEQIDTSIIAEQQKTATIAKPIAEQESPVNKREPATDEPKKQADKKNETAVTGLTGSGLEIAIPLADPPNMKDKQKGPPRFGIGLNLSFSERATIFKNPPRNRLPFYANVCYLLNKAWRLEAGYEIRKFQFSSFDPLGPLPPPPNTDYSISKTDVAYLTSVYSMGVHRNFRLKKRLQPSLLIELLAIQGHRTRLYFKYTSQTPSSPDITISSKYGKTIWSLENLRFGAGLSYKILPWLEGRAQGGYRVSAIGSRRDSNLSPIFSEQNLGYWQFYCKFGVMGYF